VSDTDPPVIGDAVMTKQASVAAAEMGTKGFTIRQAVPEGLDGKYVNVVLAATTPVASGKVSVFFTIGQDSD